MSARLQLRGDTLANWLKYDPVLMEREVALIASNPDKPKVYDLKKVGDGTSKFSELPMLGYECLQDTGDSQQFPMSQKAVTDAITKAQNSIVNIGTLYIEWNQYGLLSKINEINKSLPNFWHSKVIFKALKDILIKTNTISGKTIKVYTALDLNEDIKNKGTIIDGIDYIRIEKGKLFRFVAENFNANEIDNETFILKYLDADTEQSINNTKSLITLIQNDLYVNGESSPNISYNDIDIRFYQITQVWTTVDFVKKFISNNKKLFVKDIIFKTDRETVKIHSIHVEDNGDLKDLGVIETVNLSEEYLAPDLGDNMYRVHINKILDYIPAVDIIYYKGQVYENGNGYIRNGMNINTWSSRNEAKYPVAISYTYNESLVKKNYNDIRNIEKTISEYNIFKGKKIGFMGDSITYGQYSAESYAKILSNDLQMNMQNVAVPGATLSSIYNQIDNLQSDLDIIVFMGGINDYMNDNNSQIGSIFENNDSEKRILRTDTTVCGWLNKILTKLRNKYPTKFICMLTPPKSSLPQEKSVNSVYNKSKSGNYYFENLIQSIKEASLWHSIPLFDLNSEAMLNSSNGEMAKIYYTHIWDSESQSRDLTHMNEKGHRLIAEWLKGKFLLYKYIILI